MADWPDAVPLVPVGYCDWLADGDGSVEEGCAGDVAGVADGDVEPVVPVAVASVVPVVPVVVSVIDEVVAELIGFIVADASLGDGDGPAPPAARSNSFSCARNWTSFCRSAGSSVADAVPLVPTAPVVPVGAGVAVALASSGPRSIARFALTLAYGSRQLAFVVISSLKFVISCETWVRASPESCAAAGSCVTSLSVLRASVR